MTNDSLAIRFERAVQNDADLLTKNTFKSKRIWGYTDEQMERWKDELTITPAYIAKNKVYKIFHETQYLGFISLLAKRTFIEIDHFWLLPKSTGKGYGRTIFAFIVQTEKEMNFNRIKVYSEPNADGFYRKMGGEIVHRIESKIKGRFLAVFEFRI